MAGMLVVRAQHVVGPGAAVGHRQHNVRVRGRHFLQQRLEGMFCTVAQPVDQVHTTTGLFGQAPAQHAHHWRDADATGHQHGRYAGVGVDEEVAGGRFCLEHVACLDTVVKVVRRHTRRQFRAVRRRRHALDGDAVAALVRPVGQRVAARHRTCTARRVTAFVEHVERERQELAGLEGRQRCAVDWLEVEGALRLRGILVRTRPYPEFAPAGPGGAGGRLHAVRHGWQATRRATSPPQDDTDPHCDLEQQRGRDPGQELDSSHVDWVVHEGRDETDSLSRGAVPR